MKLAVVGLGKLGSCLAASLAASGYEVYGFDHDLRVRARLRERINILEPQLLKRLSAAGDSLVFRGNVRMTIRQTDVSFIVVPTPSRPLGDFNADAVHDVLCQIEAAAHPGHITVIVSTVSPGTMARFATVFPSLNLVYSPLFIALGQIISDLERPDFRLVGATNPTHADKVCKVLRCLDRRGDIPYLVMSPAEAEIVKLGVNAFLTTKAAFSTTIAMACQSTEGVNAQRVLAAIGADHRIGSAFMAPGPAPGGPCLPRDTVALKTWLDWINAPAYLPMGVVSVFERQLRWILEWVHPYRRVAILGTTYKPDTPITEASFGSELAAELNRDRETTLHDPWRDVSIGEVLDGADAAVIATNHPEYRGLRTLIPTLDMWGIVAPGPHVTTFGSHA